MQRRSWKKPCSWNRGAVPLLPRRVLESLDFEEDVEIPQAWRDEIQRRCEQIDRGEVGLIDSDAVMAELRMKHD